MNELISLLGYLESVSLVEKGVEFKVSEVDPSGYESFFPINDFPFFLFHVIWKTPIPPKVQVLLRTHDHILIHCPFTSCLSFKVLEELGLGSSKIYAQTFCSRSWTRSWQDGRIIWNMVVRCMCWSICLEKNRRIFANLE